MIGTNTETLDEGRLAVRREFLSVLQACGLDTFEKIMACAGGRVMRSVPGRSTVRLELRPAGDGVRVVFLKRYEPEYLTLGQRLLRFLRWPGARDEAFHEWKAIEELRAQDFNTATAIAVGQEKKFGVVTRSFLMTAEIVGGIAAHDCLRTLSPKARRELTTKIADLTRRFHSAGFAHKDYYLSHIFVVPLGAEASKLQLFFIDLQRLIRPRILRGRWLVKDLAALGYSARLAGATRGDLLCFYKTCFERSRLTTRDRKLIRRITARVRALERRSPKYDVIWDQPGVHPPNV